jgi:nitroreductase
MVPSMSDIDVTATDRLLTATRSVRRRLDLTRPVPLGLIEECLTVALQAPTGGNLQFWRWIVVTDADQRARIADLYAKAWAAYRPTVVDQQFPAGDPRGRQLERSVDSAQYLADHVGEVPVLVVPCVPALPPDNPFMATTLLASMLPAVWSFMLAARSRGLGTTLTTLTLMHERAVAEVLDLPDGMSHCALVPVAYFTGESFQAVERLPVRTVTYHDRWTRAFPGGS